MNFYDIIGVVGSATIVISYFANQQDWLSAHDWRYSILNLVGALMILASLYWAWNLAAAVMEGFWALISLWGLAKALRSRPHPH